MIRRFAFIEARLLWGGGLTAGELAKAFGIARQNAQRTIDAYRCRHPQQMEYDKHRKRQVRKTGFETNYVQSDVSRFLEYQRAATHTARFYDEPDWVDLPFTDADALVRRIYDRASVRAVLEALRRRAVVEIEYWSKAGTRVRRISPHRLIFADGRYHVRAFCHEDQVPLDFVLTRVVAAVPVDDPWVSDESDDDWHQRLDLGFAINPGLPDSARDSIRLDFITDGTDRLVIRGVRKALALYIRRRLCRSDWRFAMPLWVVVDDTR
ncbi:MAG: WYL domain-containing protein [Pseudomonadota bacterium]|nr:WYL domain-containing protein [Pseudomonadota bacterium]